jgi:hypothetical protein
MTMTPGYGEEELMRQRSEAVLRRDREGVAEHEIVEEHDREDRELEHLEPEDNEAHAAGKVCERCGAVITAGQDVRLLADGHWAHEVRP